MPTIEKCLKVKTFTTPDGAPTCATNMQTGEYCMFYGTSHFGTRDECLATGSQISRVSQGGFTIPVSNCPMNKAVVMGC